MKVLIVHCGKGICGGAEEVIAQLMKYLVRQGAECKYSATNLPVGMFRAQYGGQNLTRSYLGLWREVQRLSEWADIINVHNFPATLAPFPTKKPIVWMCNEPAELFTNWWRKPIEAFNRWWVKKSGMKVVVADRFNAKRFLDIYGVTPKIIPYGVDYEFWSGKEKHPHSSFNVVQVGTLKYPWKNQLASIEAMEKLRKDMPNARLVLIGLNEGSYAESVLTYIKDKGLEWVTITGELPREKVREWYRNCDILLHPVKEQGGWLVPFEAMCAGLPVITVPSFSASDTILENNLGRVTSRLGEAVMDVIENRDAYALQVEGAREWVRENLTWEKFGAGMVKIFEEAISKRCS